MRISVVIPAFNNWRLTSRCITTLRRATPPELIAEVVVVDDASTDEETATWTGAQEGIVPVLLTHNRGFSAACNAGAMRCSGDAILFLNNDAFIQPGALQALHDSLAGDERIGIVGGRLLYSDGSLQHAGLALLPGEVSRWWHIYKRHDGQLADAAVPRDLLAVTGAALLIRHSLFERLDGFDERFVNGWEDVDLCLRAWCAGQRVRYEPGATFEHLESATIGHDKNHEQNERRFVERWAAILAQAPRYSLPEVPPVAFAAGNTDPDDAWALAHIARWWKVHLGAAVLRTRPGSRIDRARVDILAAFARRRPTLEISWGDACLSPATGVQRIAFVTPKSAAMAATYARVRGVARWWVPTEAARSTLCEAGVPSERITVVRLGAEIAAPRQRSGPPTVAGTLANIAVLEQLVQEMPEVCIRIIPAGIRPSLTDVDILVASNGDDRYGLLLPTALGHGCAVIASSPVDSQVAISTGVSIVDPAVLFDTLRSRVHAINITRACALERYLDARRRLDAYLATQHVAELARATTGGIPSASPLDPAFARHLRAAHREPLRSR